MLDRLTVDEVKRAAALAEEADADRRSFLASLRSADLGGQEKERGSRTPTDLDRLDMLPEGASPALEELQRFLADLTVEQRLELRALAMIGRGDFAANQWEEAVGEAARPPDAADTADLAEKVLLHDDLMKGLYALDTAARRG